METILLKDGNKKILSEGSFLIKTLIAQGWEREVVEKPIEKKGVKDGKISKSSD